MSCRVPFEGFEHCLTLYKFHLICCDDSHDTSRRFMTVYMMHEESVVTCTCMFCVATCHYHLQLDAYFSLDRKLLRHYFRGNLGCKEYISKLNSND